MTEAGHSVQLVSQYDPNLLPPQPLILDPQLRFPLGARVLLEWNSCKSDPKQLARQPWLICGDDADQSRREILENAGARIIPVPLDTQGKVRLTAQKADRG